MRARPELSIDLPLDDPHFWAADPLDAFRHLREVAPVHYHPSADLWSVATHAEVLAVSRDASAFQNGQGILLADRERRLSGADSIIYLDPPSHSVYRRLVSPSFHRRVVAGLETFIRDLACSLLDRVVPGEELDGMASIAVPLPMLVIAEMLGIPGGELDRFKRWSDAMIQGGDAFSDDTLVQAAELYQYFTQIADERRSDPGDDLVSLLVDAEVDGERLSSEELLGFCMTLLVAGNETTRNLISGGLLALARYPDQLARLRAEPSLVATAVEEMLRWVTPVNGFCRTATREVGIGGQTINEGDYVLMLYTSANRDTAEFGPTVDDFDVGRDPTNHVSFGWGEHFCLGAGLARLEGRVMFEEIVTRFDSVELAGSPERLPSTLMNSLRSLPLRLR